MVEEPEQPGTVETPDAGDDEGEGGGTETETETSE